MADTPAPAAAKSSSSGTWFTRKIGPLPAWGWGAVAVGIYYWYTHYGPGASKQTGTAQQPATGGGLQTYAPRITETIRETITNRRPPGRKPGPKPPPRPGGGRAAAPMTGPGVNPGGPDRDPRDRDKRDRDRKPKPQPPPRRQPPPPPGREPPPASPPPGPEQVASATYAPGGFQTGGAVNADTGQPVYWEWQHAHRGPEVPVPQPVQAYAPMTNGSVYDAGSTAAELAAAG